MRTKVLLGIALLVCVVLTSCGDDNRSDYYGEWEWRTVYALDGLTISADSLIIWNGEKFVILEWEEIKNKKKTSNASYPDGYVIKTENMSGNPLIFGVWIHSKDKDRIAIQLPWFGDVHELYRSSKKSKEAEADKTGSAPPSDELEKSAKAESSAKTPSFTGPTFTDPRDGKKYGYVKIGDQTWMAQNLDYHGEDGFLGLCYDDEPRNKIKKPENCQKYGRLYDWNEAKKACPSGWHLPDNNEWAKLMLFLASNKKDVRYGKENVQGTTVEFYENAGKYLKAKSGWNDYDFSEKNPNAPKCKWTEEEIDNRGRVTVTEHDNCSTDEYSFSALPGGLGRSDGSFNYVGNSGHWWSTSEGNSNDAYRRSMGNSTNYVFLGLNDKSTLYSVRCVQD